MTLAEYIVERLVEKGTTDAFGIPGGVILDFLYTLTEDNRIQPHLSYHEQCAAFEAGAYAQSKGCIGVAYATRGPGIMNMVTSIADAYCDSIPLLVFTAHGSVEYVNGMRVMDNQEFDLIPIFQNITKKIVRIDRIETAQREIDDCIELVNSGRKGPVVVDVRSNLWKTPMPDNCSHTGSIDKLDKKVKECVSDICLSLKNSKRPVILIGEGVKAAKMMKGIGFFANKCGIPILSSRYSEDALSFSDNYYGYIGSHAVRYSNFILSKADLIISMGNRMAFPVNSKSFRPVIDNCCIIRIDIDESEFIRDIPNAHNYNLAIEDLIPELLFSNEDSNDFGKWNRQCASVRNLLYDVDVTKPVQFISNILSKCNEESVITSDVGNNELWLSRAYIYASCKNRILYSKTFGALGCSVAKAIGAYYATRRHVLCFAGDQGIQLNIQELQVIGSNLLPITVVVLNNQSSGMIRSAENTRFGYFVHTTDESGYNTANLSIIAKAYNIEYQCFMIDDDIEIPNICEENRPRIIEVVIGEENEVYPLLKKGDPCQKLFPYLDNLLYEKAEKIFDD